MPQRAHFQVACRASVRNVMWDGLEPPVELVLLFLAAHIDIEPPLYNEERIVCLSAREARGRLEGDFLRFPPGVAQFVLDRADTPDGPAVAPDFYAASHDLGLCNETLLPVASRSNRFCLCAIPLRLLEPFCEREGTFGKGLAKVSFEALRQARTWAEIKEDLRRLGMHEPRVERAEAPEAQPEGPDEAPGEAPSPCLRARGS